EGVDEAAAEVFYRSPAWTNSLGGSSLAEFKAVIADPKDGKSYKRDITGHYANALIGKKLGDDLDGLYVGLPGYKLQITGGSDKDGFPMRTERLTGERTDRHSEEIKRGISIRLGYADMAIYKCPKDAEPAAYQTTEVCKTHNVKGELQRIVSFVDSPGHETLMATMLSGAAIMDGALLVIAANEDVPQPQTKEHLMALGIIGVNKIVIVQNKIDIVDPKQAEENYKQIQAFVKG